MSKISLTVKQLVAATSVTGRPRVADPSAMQRFFQCPKPASVAWANRKLIAACNEEIRLYDEHRLELCKKHGVLNPKTNMFDFANPASEAEFNRELAALQDQVVDLPGIPVKIEYLGGTLSEIDLQLLEPFIVG